MQKKKLNHIAARGNHRNYIFRNDEDFQYYLTVIEEASCYYGNHNYDNQRHRGLCEARMTELAIINVNSNPEIEITLEVYPTKISYKEDYKAILIDVSEEIYQVKLDSGGV